MDEPEDMALIQRYAAGDEHAFEQLYHRYRKQLYGFLYNMLNGSAVDPDELFEETWIKVIEKLPQYQDQGKFSAWLFRVARNLFIDRIRAEKKREFMLTGDELPDVPDWSMRPEKELETRDTLGMIEQALSALPAEQREVFLLRQQGLAFKEISAIQNCSLNTVLGRMHYAIGTLRKIISGASRKGGVI